MTVIVGALTKHGVTIAADSEATGGWQKTNLATPKLWVNGGFAFGAAGTLRTAQVLRHHVEWPEPSPEDLADFEAFLIRKVVPAIRRGVKGHGVTEKHKGTTYLPVELLVANGSELAGIDGDGCVTANDFGRMATGSGYAEALGALGADGPWREKDVVEAARRAAITAVGVGGPIMVVNTRTLTVRAAA